MTRVLITAFEPYDRWKENSSWLALIDFTSWYDGDLDITTRRYPVNLEKVCKQLESDLQDNYDLVIHLGQSPGSPVVKLENVALNLRTNGNTLVHDGPAAYHSKVNVAACQQRLSAAGIPSKISHHAGTYLCNALLYLSQHFCEMMGRESECIFVHLPLTPAQVAADQSGMASMSTPMQGVAISVVAQTLAEISAT